jgi:hypothetical protein
VRRRRRRSQGCSGCRKEEGSGHVKNPAAGLFSFFMLPWHTTLDSRKMKSRKQQHKRSRMLLEGALTS